MLIKTVIERKIMMLERNYQMKVKNKKYFAILMALIAALGVTAPGIVTLSPTVSAASIQASTDADSRQKAEEVLKLVNEARQQAGLSPLAMSDSLQTTADIRAKEIVESFSHTRPNEESCFTAGPDLNGENLAAGYPTPAAVFDGWMNSQGHRENILRPAFKTIGISYYQDPNGSYNYYWVQMFSVDETPGLLTVSSDGSIDASLSKIMDSVKDANQVRVSIPRNDAVNQEITVRNSTLWKLRQRNGVEKIIIDIVDSNNNKLSTKTYSTANTNNGTVMDILSTPSNVSTTPSVPSPTPVSVTLDTSTVTLDSNRNTYAFLVKGNRDVRNLQVSVANPNIASVSLQDANDSRGAKYMVTAKAPGQTTVQVTYQGKTASMIVNVQSVPSTSASKGSIMLDTANYIMAPGNIYDIGVTIKDASGNKLSANQVKDLVSSGKLKVQDSRTGSIANLQQLSNGNFRVTGKNPGTCYIVYDIGGTHASVKIDVQNGVKQHGTAVRNTSYFTQSI